MTARLVLNDPVAILAILTLIAGAGVLIWAVSAWTRLKNPEDVPSPEPASTPTPPPGAESGPTPATPEPVDLIPQLVERLNQLTERVYLLEKTVQEIQAQQIQKQELH